MISASIKKESNMARKSPSMLNLERYTSKPTQTKSVSVKLPLISHTALSDLATLTGRSVEELLVLLIDDLVLPVISATLTKQAKKGEAVVASSTSLMANKVEITPAGAAPLAAISLISTELIATPPIRQSPMQPLAAPSAVQSQFRPVAPSFSAATAGPALTRREPFNTPPAAPAPLGLPASPTLPKSNPPENR